MDREEAERLTEFLAAMDDVIPAIPDHVAKEYLDRSGFVCDDVRVTRMLSIAAQHFVAEIVHDAMQYYKSRQEKKGAPLKPVLLMDDLALALQDHGISSAKPPFFVDHASRGKG